MLITKNRKLKTIFAFAPLLIFTLALLFSLPAYAYNFDRFAVTGGGGSSNSTGYKALSTIGQAVMTGKSSSAGYVASAGLWPGAFAAPSQDTSAPTGTVAISAGAAYATSASVTLGLSCTDASGCAQMQFSNDNVTYSSAEAYATSKAWTLISGDGLKTVYAKFKDGAGNWSTAKSDTITLDGTPPATSAIVPAGTYAAAQSVTLTCADAGSGCGNIYYTTDGSTPTIGSPVYSGPIVVPSSLTLKYFARDNAGNAEGVKSAAYAINTLPSAPTGIALSDMKTGGPTISWAAVTGATGYKVYRSKDNSTWGAAIGSPTGNSFTDTTAPESNTRYFWTVTAYNASGESSKPAGVEGRTALLSGWNMVSAPYNTAGALPITVYGAWATWTWDWEPGGSAGPDKNGYWYQSPQVHPCLCQLLWAPNDATVLDSTVKTPNAASVEITLMPGWNLVSNPTTTDMTGIGASWTVDGTALSSAISGNKVGGDLYWWNGSTYESMNVAMDSPVVEPWKGYWILNPDSVSHKLTIK